MVRFHTVLNFWKPISFEHFGRKKSKHPKQLQVTLKDSRGKGFLRASWDSRCTRSVDYFSFETRAPNRPIHVGDHTSDEVSNLAMGFFPSA